MAFLAPRNALAVAIMSYNGSVFINLIGDYDAMPDLDRLAEYVEESIAELRQLAARDGATAPRHAREPQRLERAPGAEGAAVAVVGPGRLQEAAGTGSGRTITVSAMGMISSTGRSAAPACLRIASGLLAS